MKKLSYLIGLLLIGGLLFSSCKKTGEDATPPSLSFLGGTYENTSTGWTAERVDQDMTFTVGDPFVFGFTATSTTDKNLSRVLVTLNFENVSLVTVLDSAVSVASYQLDIETIAYPNAGDEIFTITVTDKNSLSTSISFKITSVAAEPNISTYTGISLGSYASTTNSSFASITGETFSVTDITNDPVSQKKVDFVYFHGNSYGHTLAAPSSDVAGQTYSTTVGTWADENRNHTTFGLTNLTVAQYNSVENKTQLILSIQNDGVQLDEDIQSELLSNPAGFAVGDIIAFETYDGNQGLIRLTDINPGATNGESVITYDLKVEKPANR